MAAAATAPSASTSPSPATNLSPLAPTQQLDERGHELAWVKHLRSPSRLVTLTGTLGIIL